MLNKRGLGGADWMHVSSSLWFSREYSSYFCSNLKALEVEGIWHLSPFWGWCPWDGWSCGWLPWNPPDQKVFTYTDDGGQSQTRRIKWTTLPVNRCRHLTSEEGAVLAQWHIQWHIRFHAFLLLFVCLGKYLKKLKKKLSCLNVKYKMWLTLNNVCVSTSSLTLKRQKAYFVSQPA